jgi:hypothetical protein
VPDPRPALEAELLAAHAARDLHRLAQLYEQAADLAETLDAECFFLTHPYIFALDAGASGADRLRARLVAHGREE